MTLRDDTRAQVQSATRDLITGLVAIAILTPMVMALDYVVGDAVISAHGVTVALGSLPGLLATTAFLFVFTVFAIRWLPGRVRGDRRG